MDSFAILPTTLAAVTDRDATEAAVARVFRTGGVVSGYLSNGKANPHALMGPGKHFLDWAFQGEWGNDFGQLGKALREGRAWPKTMDDYKKFQVEVDLNLPYMHQVRRHRVWDDLHGDSADIGRALVAIAPWEQFRRTAAKRAVTIGYHLTMSVGRSGDVFRANTVAATRLADALMAAGYDVRIVGLQVMQTSWTDNTDRWSGEGAPQWLGYTFPIKEFGSPLDEQAMLALGTPAHTRDIGFNHFLTLFPQITQWKVCGRAQPIPADIQDALGIDLIVAKQFDRGTAEQYIQQQAETMKEKLEGKGTPDTVDPFATTREE